MVGMGGIGGGGGGGGRLSSGSSSCLQFPQFLQNSGAV